MHLIFSWVCGLEAGNRTKYRKKKLQSANVPQVAQTEENATVSMRKQNMLLMETDRLNCEKERWKQRQVLIMLPLVFAWTILLIPGEQTLIFLVPEWRFPRKTFFFFTWFPLTFPKEYQNVTLGCYSPYAWAGGRTPPTSFCSPHPPPPGCTSPCPG